MNIVTSCLVLSLCTCLLASPARSQGGFREMLEIIGIEHATFQAIDVDQPSADDWQTISQIVVRLGQHSADLDRWTKTDAELRSSDVGELFEVTGTVESVVKLTPPAGIELKQLYQCQLKLVDRREATVLSVQIPEGWKTDVPMDEPASLRGVLLRAEGNLLLLTTYVRWYPQKGLPAGQLLLARFGMDAALWDDVVQRTAFISPEMGREAEAFYACLAAIAKVPVKELAMLTLKSIAETAAAKRVDVGTKQERQIAAAVIEQAALGLSSVAPLFLDPGQQIGRLVRIEGTARRAVRIVADDRSAEPPNREYYELEVFTADSQNLPIVCCVARLPPGFPVGDAIRAGVRIDGVFFKLWRYHSRQTKEAAGATTIPQSSYTPVVMAPTVTWLKQAPAPERWWGLALSGIVFVFVMGGLLRIMLAWRTPSRKFKDEKPDFSQL